MKEKEYESKLDMGDIIHFRVEKTDKIRFKDYCFIHELNESAVLRRILRQFLKEVSK